MGYFQNYFNSFHVGKKFWLLFLIDGLAVSIITLLWLILGNMLTAKAYAISGGKSVEELKMLILSGSLETNQLLLSNIKTFVFTFYIGVIAAIIVTLLLFSLSRMIVWEKIINSTFSWKNFKKWNGLILAFLLLMLVYGLVWVMVRLIVNIFINLMNETAFIILSQVINFIFIIAGICFMFLLFRTFQKTHQVWHSIGDTFHVIKVSWSKLWKQYLFILFTGLIIGFIVSYLQRFFFQLPNWLFPLISTLIFLLFFSWMRMYVLNLNKHEPRQTHQK